jgi:hypothetical protein
LASPRIGCARFPPAGIYGSPARLDEAVSDDRLTEYRLGLDPASKPRAA